MVRRMLVVSAIALASVVATGHAEEVDGLFTADLSGFQEVPAISTEGHGLFEADLDGDEIRYTLSYEDIEGAVAQAHIHLGQEGANGGVSVFLCTNMDNGPEGTPACPPPPATVTGTIIAALVLGPDDQGISAGELDELLAAMDAGVTYVNVHSDLFPDGEVRGQVGRNLDGDEGP